MYWSFTHGDKEGQKESRPTLKVLKDGKSIGQAKPEAAKSKASKRLSKLEKGIDSLGEKRLKMDKKKQQLEIWNAAFNSITTLALQMQQQAGSNLMLDDDVFTRAKSLYDRDNQGHH
ncbi:hypothetical protein OC834_006817 [Tilletia horrida]|nr:hypothetical protein OC834_006817 [Tilletia horrida]